MKAVGMGRTCRRHGIRKIYKIVITKYENKSPFWFACVYKRIILKCNIT
jgi:hypothetical protein